MRIFFIKLSLWFMFFLFKKGIATKSRRFQNIQTVSGHFVTIFDNIDLQILAKNIMFPSRPAARST